VFVCIADLFPCDACAIVSCQIKPTYLFTMLHVRATERQSAILQLGGNEMMKSRLMCGTQTSHCTLCRWWILDSSAGYRSALCW